jgi:drug/metabolite transporter (DMT)-like permease
MIRLAGFVVSWALLEGAVGSRLAGHYHLMQVVWCRYAVHLATLVLLFGWRRPQRLWQTVRPMYQLTRSLLMLVMPLSFSLAIGLGIAPDNIWSVFWVSPLIVIGAAQGLLGERPSWRLWAISGAGALATVGMLSPGVPTVASLLLPTLMALCFGLYVPMTRELRLEPVRTNLFYTALGVFLSLTPFMPIVWTTPSLRDAALLVGIGLIGLIALLALDRAAALAPVSAGAPVLYLQVVFVAALRVLLDGEHPSRRSLAGAAVIVTIVGLLWMQKDPVIIERSPRSALLEDAAP